MDAPKIRTLRPDDYTIGWICALPCEMAASRAMLDELHGDLHQRRNDSNTYTFGSVGAHNIVIACLPSGVYGTTSAATVAIQMLASFPSIRFGIMVGIGGGVPGGDTDIRLGDIIVSKPTGTFGGVVQYDFGKTIQGGEFVRVGSLNKPPLSLLTGVSKLEAGHMLGLSKIPLHLSGMIERYPAMKAKFTYLGQFHDRVFRSDYEHLNSETTCENCDVSRLIERPLREGTDPVIHYGIIASGNQVIKHGATRDRLRRELGILCFEMEAAGLMDSFPCLVVRGICDYADSHKNKLWQEYAAATAAAYAKELVLAIPPDQVLHSPTAAEVTMATEANFTIPFILTGCPRISKFVGRDDYIQAIERFLLPVTDKGEPKILVLHGVGGIGKTQLAAQFAKSYRDQFSAVFWVNGKTESALRTSLAAIIDRIPSASGLHKDKLSGDEGSTEMAIRIVIRWLGLSGNFRWLIVFDSIDSQSQSADKSIDSDSQSPSLAYDIRKYLDLMNHGSVIITSRLSYMSQLGKGMTISSLTLDEGLQVLRSINSHIDDEGALNLARRLDGLPLGLSHAACYMAQKGISPHQYLQRYNEELAGRKKLLEHVPRLSSYNVSLMTTWEMSLAAVQDENPFAIKFLMLSSFLHNADLHFELFRHSPVPNGDWLYEIAQSEDFFLDQIEVLSNFSFLQPNDGTDPVSYSIHPVVQDWGRDRLQKMEWIDNLRRCISIVGAAVPSKGSTEAWETRRRLISHADRCAELLDKYPDSKFEAFPLLGRFGRLYFDYHRLGDAERVYKRALGAYRLGLGPKDSATLNTMNGLAMVHQSQGRLAEAKKLLQATLDGYQEKKALEDIFGVCMNFACIYTDEGDLHRAELILRKAIEHLGVSTSVHQKQLSSVLFNLSRVFKQQGLLIDAENLLELVLQRYRKVLGPHNISVYDCMNNLGNIYKDQGRFLDAEDAFQTAIAGYSKILGPDHVMTLMVSDSLHDLRVPMTRENLDERVKSCRRILKKQEDARGLRSLAALGCMVNLGMSLSANGEFKEASLTLQQAYQNLSENFGPNHSHTISALSGLGCLYGKQKRLIEARSFLQSALARSEEVHGREDPRTLHILCNLADLCNDERRSEEAEAIFLKVIRSYEKMFGVDNVSTLGVVQRLGRFYLNNGRMAEAECNLAKALQGFRKVLGTNHSHTLNVAEELSLLRHIQQLQASTKVTYRAFCGKPEPGGCLFPFLFVEEAPSLLCDKSQAQHPEYDEILRTFINSTISRHEREILLSRPWTCEICGGRARELFHSAIPFLVPGGHSSADFEPTLWDTVIPICRFSGECDRKAEEMAHASSKEILPTGIFDTESRTCNTCLLKKKVKLCTGCRTISYCSKECQTRDWQNHKKYCKQQKQKQSSAPSVS
ncbi:hypothetical protein BDZ45DRAFT_679979 [Acephala macrosclerotiorum]|nr:hypothetical protein BDZ45DRAFT_679979 [Acephala macrosclerotiorum]